MTVLYLREKAAAQTGGAFHFLPSYIELRE